MAQEEIIVRRGLAKKHASVDYEVWQWKKTVEQSRGSQRITKNEVQKFALEAYKKAGISNFKASDGWYRRWRLRWQNTDIIRKNKVKDGIVDSPEPCNKTPSTSRKKYSKSNKSKSKVENDKTTGSTTIDAIESVKDTLDFPQVLGLVRVGQANLATTVLLNLENGENDLLNGGNCQAKSQDLLDESLKLTKDTNNESSTPKLLLDSKEKQLLTVVVEKNSTISCHSNLSTPVLDISINSSDILEGSLTSLILCNENIKGIELPSGNIPDTTEDCSKSYNFENVLEERIHAEENSTNSSRKKATINSHKETSFADSHSSIGTSFPLESVNAEAFNGNSLKIMFDRNHLDLGDHEFFCNFCEDFHPHNKGSHFQYCKQSMFMGNSLWNCVLKQKDSVTTSDVTPSKTKNVQEIESSLRKVEKGRKKAEPQVTLPKGKRYQIHFKTKVINYALNHSVKQASEKFHVNRGTVSEWVVERKRFSNCSSSKPLYNEKTIDLDDSEFLSWLDNSKFNLTSELIKQKTAELQQLEDCSKNNCHWLYMYAHRLHGTENTSIKKRYIAYPDTFKRVVVFYSETHSNLAAARVFNVARRRVLAWQQVLGSGKKKKVGLVRSFCNVTDRTVDKQVFEWYSSQKSPPSSKQVRDKGVELYRLAGHHSIQCAPQWYYRWRARHKLPASRDHQHSDSQLLSWALAQLDNNQCVTHTSLAAQAQVLANIKASRGWTFRFCKKHHKLLLTVPEPSTPLPSAMEVQVTAYRKYLQNSVATCGITDGQIIAMDEIPLQFLPKDSNKKPLLIRRPGFESCQASLVISSLSDGTLLPTLFIFKASPPTRKNDPSVVSCVNSTGLMSKEIMTQWINCICLNHLQRKSGILISDCFDVHTSEEIQHTLAEHNVQHAVIPGGCAFKLLPIHQVCQQFKGMIEEMCHTSLASQTSALRSPSSDQLYEWTIQVHNHLAKHQKENIKADFKKLLFQLPQVPPLAVLSDSS